MNCLSVRNCTKSRPRASILAFILYLSFSLCVCLGLGPVTGSVSRIKRRARGPPGWLASRGQEDLVALHVEAFDEGVVRVAALADQRIGGNKQLPPRWVVRQHNPDRACAPV